MIWILLFFIILIVTSASSLLFLFKWKYLATFILLNISIIIIYITIMYFINDTYNFGFFFRILTYVTLQSSIIFIFSIYKNLNLNKNDKTT